MRKTGAQVVVAGNQGQQRGGPQQHCADLFHGDESRSGLPDDQEPDRRHLDCRLPLRQARDRQTDAQFSKVFTQSRDQNLST
jgi:hypothetical protein